MRIDKLIGSMDFMISVSKNMEHNQYGNSLLKFLLTFLCLL